MALTWVGNKELQTVALGSAYTAGSGVMVLETGLGALLPATGDFYIRNFNNNGSPVAPADLNILKVTSRTGDTLTVVGGQDGTTDQNLANNTPMVWVLSASALDQLIADIIATPSTALQTRPGSRTLPKPDAVVYGTGELSANINNSVTSLTLSASISTPATPFYTMIGTEQIEVTVVAGATWTITRGTNGTTAASHNAGDTVTITNWSLLLWNPSVVSRHYDDNAGIVQVRVDAANQYGNEDYPMSVIQKMPVTSNYVLTVELAFGNSPAISFSMGGLTLWDIADPTKIIATEVCQYNNGTYYAPIAAQKKTVGVDGYYGSIPGLTANALYNTKNYTPFPGPYNPIFIRQTDDGTNITQEFSFDGFLFYPLCQWARSAYIIPTYFGVHSNPRNAWPATQIQGVKWVY